MIRQRGGAALRVAIEPLVAGLRADAVTLAQLATVRAFLQGKPNKFQT
jgi:hypothetical protein